MKGRNNIWAALALLALLAGCGGDKSSSDARIAEGEVLEGSISDAMLPLDRLQSQAPLAEPEDDDDTGTSKKDAASADDKAKDEGAADDQPAISADPSADDPIGAIAQGE